MRIHHFLLIVNACLCPIAAGQTAAVTAPVRCKTPSSPSCGADLTLNDAKESFARVLEKHGSCKVLGPGADAHETTGQCAPLESVTDFNICGEIATVGEYFWAPSDKMQDGGSVLRTMLSRAKEGTVFGNEYMIVETSESTPAERHFALCGVRSIRGVQGPPTDCTTIAILTPDQTWLRGGNRNQMFCNAMATFRPSGAIDIDFDLLAHSSLQKVSASLLSLLQTNMGLQAVEQAHGQNGDYISIESTSGLRESKILGGGWRESVNLDVAVDRVNEGKIRVHATANVGVCRQNVGSVTAYHGLNDAQRSAYSSELDSLLGEALRDSCVNGHPQDSKTIVCD